MDTSPSLQETIQAWQAFLSENDWRKLIEGVTPKQTGCGPVYELPNHLERPNESFAIADMREVKVAEPHYHPGECVEIYLVLQGSATVVVGGEEHKVGPGDSVIIPPDNAHFTVPNNEFVIAAVNIPAFQLDHYVVIDPTKSDPKLHFDAEQFRRFSVKARV